ncbi:MAG: hypothetical protein M3Q30_28280 [Actinomycetota bacterium]|nr:hypothetical protein [Actinomycetota bacterium]
MLPILAGRIQTRIFLLGVIGSLWTLVITPILPPLGAPLHERYRATFTVLVVVLVVGLAWECLYHLLQQFRWEKDWPAFFGFLTGINEGIVAWLIVQHVDLPGHPQVNGTAFIIDFTTVWIVTWLFVNGPMRVVFLHWRFRGGRII